MSEKEQISPEESVEKKSVDVESKTDSQNQDKESNKADPVRRITKIVLTICLIIFIWYLFADRYTPFTDQARIKTLVVPIVPRVSGYLTDVNVRLHSLVSEKVSYFSR